MKHFFSNILFRIIPALAAIVMTTGCDSVIYDDEGDCDPVHIVRFEYDWNMKFVDAFPSEVPSVDLYIFNSDGKLVDMISREVTREQAKDFSIELRGYEKGTYKFLAWCGVRDSEHFLVNPDGVDEPQLEHHICRINSLDEEDVNGHVRKDILRLYHGTLDNVDLTADEGRHEHVVKLKKNTNVVRVVLQHLSGAPMDKDDYDIKITASNGLYAHDNSILPHRELTYHPWLIRSGEASFHPEDQPEQSEESRAQTSVSAVIAELTVGRLMEEHIKDARLTVHTRDGQLIFSIPLIEYLLLVKGYYYGEDGHTPMGDQEYLDRQDEYPMTFFLDEQNKWISTVIYINAWRVVRDTPTIH